jgi:hypothetical protein
MPFEDREGGYVFYAPTPGWGYVAQLNECFAKQGIPFRWETLRIGGDDHLPQFRSVPIREFF